MLIFLLNAATEKRNHIYYAFDFSEHRKIRANAAEIILMFTGELVEERK
jgi:hypothetical protein